MPNVISSLIVFVGRGGRLPVAPFSQSSQRALSLLPGTAQRYRLEKAFFILQSTVFACGLAFELGMISPHWGHIRMNVSMYARRNAQHRHRSYIGIRTDGNRLHAPSRPYQRVRPPLPGAALQRWLGAAFLWFHLLFDRRRCRPHGAAAAAISEKQAPP